MPISWKQLTFLPSREALDEMRETWSWLLGDGMSPFMCATSGDVYFEAADGGIHWLDTGRGKFDRIADTRDAFLQAMRADGGEQWLMSSLVEELLDGGAVVGADQCFGYRVLPILGGRYDGDNMVPMAATAWYGFSGHLHEQLKDLPDGATVALDFDQ